MASSAGRSLKKAAHLMRVQLGIGCAARTIVV